MPHISERVRVALVVLGAVAVSAFWAYLLTANPEPEPFSPPTQSTAKAEPIARVTVAGDGFTAATQSGGAGPAGYPNLLATRFGWQVTTLANDGAGYVTTGQFGLPLSGLTTGLVDSRPELLVIFAGRADVGKAESAAVAAAARQLYDQLRAQLPATRLVVVGPVATDAVAPAGAGEVRDALAAEVQRTPNASFVDPLTENWFTDAPPGAIAADRQHPTDVGHRVIADKLGASLEALGLAPSGTSTS